jgi:hypothetical protein
VDRQLDVASLERGLDLERENALPAEGRDRPVQVAVAGR